MAICVWGSRCWSSAALLGGAAPATEITVASASGATPMP
jgi:hypothetical protein